MNEVQKYDSLIIIIIIDNFCIIITLFSSVPKLTALYNILQQFMGRMKCYHAKTTTTTKNVMPTSVLNW